MGKTVAAWLMVAGAIGAPATGPRETVETAVVRVVEVLQQSDGPDRAQDNRAHDNQRAEIKRIARALFDFDEIARRALSRHWGGRTLEEQGEFIGLFTDLLERSYINRIEAYAGERIVYTGEAVDGPYATVLRVLGRPPPGLPARYPATIVRAHSAGLRGPRCLPRSAPANRPRLLRGRYGAGSGDQPPRFTDAPVRCLTRLDGRGALRHPGRDAPSRDLPLPCADHVSDERGGRSRPGDVPARLPGAPDAPPRRECACLAVRHRDQRREEPLPRRVTPPPGPRRGAGDPERDRRCGTRGGDAVQRGPGPSRHRRRRAAAQAAPGVHPAQGPRSGLRRYRAEPRLLSGQRAGSRVPSPPQDPPQPERIRVFAGERREMMRKPSVCQKIEPELVATAIGDAATTTAARRETHVRACAPCRQDLARYRAIDSPAGAWRGAPAPAEELVGARLTSRLADLRRRTLVYRIFPSPLGPILIARSEEGVSCIEYLTGGSDFAHSRLSRVEGVEALLDGAEVEALYRELLEYVEGRRTQLA